MSDREKKLAEQLQILEDRIKSYREILTSYTNIYTPEERIDRVVGLIDNNL